MDARERTAWRRWLASQLPDDAHAWATEHNRAISRPAGQTLLKQVDYDEVLAGFEEKVRARVRETLGEAARFFLGEDEGEVFVQDLNWITECHYWLLERKPSPSVLRGIAAFYQAHGLTLEPGVEVAAESDAARSRERVESGGRWKGQIRDLERQLQTEKDSLTYQRNEVARLTRQLGDYADMKKKMLDWSALEEVTSILRRNNEVLTTELQRRAAGKGAIEDAIGVLTKQNEALVQQLHEVAIKMVKV